ncbi:hypothetical protein DQG23_29880 [Paenibacillus contaminans]|uniref:Uncharacterized protein n=1 Tax=Paenibacillus contaminans TaxID=450362 RepID=A0A329M615_9BACL|nr:hypothetical protein DQG23_29880 [Paenibacillus contaminans]
MMAASLGRLFLCSKMELQVPQARQRREEERKSFEQSFCTERGMGRRGQGIESGIMLVINGTDFEKMHVGFIQFQ